MRYQLPHGAEAALARLRARPIGEEGREFISEARAGVDLYTVVARVRQAPREQVQEVALRATVEVSVFDRMATPHVNDVARLVDPVNERTVGVTRLGIRLPEDGGQHRDQPDAVLLGPCPQQCQGL